MANKSNSKGTERGATLVEYAFLVFFLLVITLASIQRLGQEVSQSLNAPQLETMGQ